MKNIRMASENWFIERRLDAIDAIIATRGELRRADLMRAFGISLPQASHDIQAFIGRYPDALAYDASGKRYVPAAARYRRVRKVGEDVRETFALLTSRPPRNNL